MWVRFVAGMKLWVRPVAATIVVGPPFETVTTCRLLYAGLSVEVGPLCADML